MHRLDTKVSHPRASNNPVKLRLNSMSTCRGVSKDTFAGAMYQWAATLTSSGQNMPFALPLKTDKLPSGFTISFLRVTGGVISIIAKIECQVEDVGEVRQQACIWGQIQQS